MMMTFCFFFFFFFFFWGGGGGGRRALVHVSTLFGLYFDMHIIHFISKLIVEFFFKLN